jgi:hypothetical protein
LRIIKQAYVSEAQTAKVVEISKDDLQDLELKKILLGLQSAGQIYCLKDGTYYRARLSLSPVTLDYSLITKLSVDIVVLVTKEPGKYDVSTLQNELASKAEGMRADIFVTVLNALSCIS